MTMREMNRKLDLFNNLKSFGKEMKDGENIMMVYYDTKDGVFNIVNKFDPLIFKGLFHPKNIKENLSKNYDHDFKVSTSHVIAMLVETCLDHIKQNESLKEMFLEKLEA